MTSGLALLREAIGRPVPLPYHPLCRFRCMGAPVA